jgi:tRNA-dihydrouridine synthase 2
VDEIVGTWTGKEEFENIVQAIDSHPPREHRMLLGPGPGPGVSAQAADERSDEEELFTPRGTRNPEFPGLGAPLLPSNPRRMAIPPMVSGIDAPTPSPTPPMSGGILSMAVM